MRKGLAILLGTVAFALVGANTFAKAPVISGVPDVIIGDEEDGLTIDNNWFRYVNAFNLLDYVTDEDSTPSTDLMYVFLEENSYNNLKINDKDQIDAADFDNPAAWGPNEITGFGGTRNFLLSFWDVLRSDPATQQPNPPYWSDPIDAAGDPVASDTVELLPWQTVEGSPATLGGDKRLVTMFAADEFDNIDTDTLFVMSLNAGFDDVVPEVTTLFDTNFPDGAGTQWVYNTVPGVLGECTSGAAGDGTSGYLSIQAALTAGTATLPYNYGRWIQYDASVLGYQGVIPHADGDVMYRANMTLRQDQAVTDVTPRIRFGASQPIGGQAILNITTPVLVAGDATLNPQIPAQNVQQSFTTCWSANSDAPGYDDLLWDTGGAFGVVDMRTWNCFLDVVDNQDTQAGTWFMDSLLVETIPAPAAVTPAMSVTDLAGFVEVGTSGTIPYTRNVDGSITFNDPGATGTTRNFRLLQSPVPGVVWTANQTLRVSVELSCPDAAARTNFHRFRVRTFTGAQHVSQEWLLLSADTFSALGMPSMPPVGPPHTYEMYVQPNGGASPELIALGGGYSSYTLALDQLHSFGNATAGNPTATTVHSVSVELLNIPDVY